MKILNSSANNHSDFDRLATTLNSLLDVAQNGEWTHLDNLLPTLLSASTAIQQIAQFNAGVDRERIIELLALHKRAIEECTARMSQIAPLIEAFSASKNSPDNS